MSMRPSLSVMMWPSLVDNKALFILYKGIKEEDDNPGSEPILNLVLVPTQNWRRITLMIIFLTWI